MPVGEVGSRMTKVSQSRQSQRGRLTAFRQVLHFGRVLREERFIVLSNKTTVKEQYVRKAETQIYISKVVHLPFALHSVPSKRTHGPRCTLSWDLGNVRLTPDSDCRRYNGARSVALGQRSGRPEGAARKAKHWTIASRTLAWL